MDNIFAPDYFDESYTEATEGLFSYFADVKAKSDAKLKAQRQSTVRATKAQFSSMKDKERDIAWTKLIRLLVMYGCLPSNISSKNDTITDYNLYDVSWLGYNRAYEKGITYIHIAANNQFTDSDEMIEYTKMYIERDIAEERRKEEERRREMERLRADQDRRNQELRHREYMEQMKRLNDANINLTNAKANAINTYYKY